jgi:hypothetical protein
VVRQSRCDVGQGPPIDAVESPREPAAGANLHRMESVIGTEDMVDDEYLTIVHRADAHALAAARGSQSDQFSPLARSSLLSR